MHNYFLIEKQDIVLSPNGNVDSCFYYSEPFVQSAECKWGERKLKESIKKIVCFQGLASLPTSRSQSINNYSRSCSFNFHSLFKSVVISFKFNRWSRTRDKKSIYNFVSRNTKSKKSKYTYTKYMKDISG